MNLETIQKQTRDALSDLMRAAHLRPGDIVVVGCSTSEIGGHLIGTQSNEDVAKAVMGVILPPIREAGAFLAVQCCEHLNRAIVLERAAMERHQLCEAWVKPWLHAGGAFATEAMAAFDDAVVVETLQAKAVAGMDIGGTLIGMHLRPVVVPLHTTHRHIGEAVLIMARTRPKYIGGPRARYAEEILAH